MLNQPFNLEVGKTYYGSYQDKEYVVKIISDTGQGPFCFVGLVYEKKHCEDKFNAAPLGVSLFRVDGDAQSASPGFYCHLEKEWQFPEIYFLVLTNDGNSYLVRQSEKTKEIIENICEKAEIVAIKKVLVRKRNFDEYS